MGRCIRRSFASRFNTPQIVVASSAFLFAGVVGAFIVRPFHVGMVGYDAAASVLYFERISEGRELEAFFGATPKALLTGVYGIGFSMVPDWRVVSWLGLVAYASGISAAATLAYRLGGFPAAGFVGIGMIGSAELLKDVDLAYAVSWALVCWATCGLLLTETRPRYALAGLALAVGGLARFETLIIVGLAGVLIMIGAIVERLKRRPIAGLRDRLPILWGLLSLPVQAVHDWLLTGDPFYAESVPVLGSRGVRLVDVSAEARAIGVHYAAEPVLLLLAVVGFVGLASRRRWDVVVGLIALGPGIAAFLLFLAARGIYVSNRYIAPADLALIFAGGIGVASLRMPLLGRLLVARRAGALPIVAALLGSVAALAVIRPFGPLDGSTRLTIAVNNRVHHDLDRATPAIDAALSKVDGVRAWPTNGSPTGPTGDRAVLLAPVLTVPQLAVDLRLPLSSITGTVGSSITADGRYPRVGQIVFHDVDRDVPRSAFRIFEVDTATVIGNITIKPLLVDGAHRFWLVEIDR
jgi:hypothetical protein